MRKNRLFLIVPCYNEEEMLPKTAAVLREKLGRLVREGKAAPNSRILIVDDGSRDRTWEMIRGFCTEEPVFSGLKFSRNFGHQSAILAGMMQVRKKADVVVTIDADLQQDVEALDRFLEKYQDGCEIVYGVRNDRKADHPLKKWSAGLFYKLMNLLGCHLIVNHADYRLLSHKAVKALEDYREVNLFLRGLIPQMGFPSGIVYFDVKERAAGHSKYTLRKMMNLAVSGITAMSIAPLRIIGALGALMCLFSCCVFVSCLWDWAHGLTVQGWTTSVALQCLIGGMLLLSQGVIGEYIGKIYLEAKARPRYIIESVLEKGKEKKKGRGKGQDRENEGGGSIVGGGQVAGSIGGTAGPVSKNGRLQDPCG